MSRKNSFFESKNPVLKESSLQKAAGAQVLTDANYRKMTVSGAMNKTLVLFSIMMITTFASYLMPTTFLLWTGLIGGLIMVLIASFKPHTSALTAPVYAAFEGLFVGSISAMYAASHGGIVFQAVLLTFGTLLTMLIIYKTGIIKVTEKFKAGVIMATGAVLILYVMGFIFSMFGVHLPYLHEGGMLGIGLSVVIIGVAALNLLLDFDAFEKGEEHEAPDYMEWFCAMGLMVTLVWLYVEFLRLLSFLDRD